MCDNYDDLRPVPDVLDPGTAAGHDASAARALLSRAAEHLDLGRPDLAANAARLALHLLPELQAEPMIDPATGDMVDVVLVPVPRQVEVRVDIPTIEWGDSLEDSLDAMVAALRGATR